MGYNDQRCITTILVDQHSRLFDEVLVEALEGFVKDEQVNGFHEASKEENESLFSGREVAVTSAGKVLQGIEGEQIVQALFFVSH
jgi:hypothetical protein